MLIPETFLPVNTAFSQAATYSAGTYGLALQGRFISITDDPYGAVPNDPSQAALNTTRIRGAIGKVQSFTVPNAYAVKGVLWLPPGLFYYDGCLVCEGQMNIDGPGALVYTNADGVGIGIRLGSFDSSKGTGTTATNMAIGPLTMYTTSPTATDAIYGENSKKIYFTQTNIAGGLDSGQSVARWLVAGIHFQSTAPDNCYDLYIEGCNISRVAGTLNSDNTGGVLLTCTGNGTGNFSVTKSWIAGLDTYGINVKGPASSIVIQDNDLEGFGSVGHYGAIRVEAMTGSTIANNHCEHSINATLPHMVLGICDSSSIVNNTLGGSGLITTNLITIDTFGNSLLANNNYAQAQYGFLITNACIGSTINEAGASALYQIGGALINPASLSKITATEVVQGTDSFFDGSISGNTLTVDRIRNGQITINQKLFNAGLPTLTKITGYLTGRGGIGTYTVDVNQTIGELAGIYGYVDTPIIKKYYGGNSYRGLTNKQNSSTKGDMSYKPGTANNLLTATANRNNSFCHVGDYIQNSTPVPLDPINGFLGWVCTSQGFIHQPTPATLNSTNIITLPGGTAEWTVNDAICTDTDQGGIVAGTTVTALTGTTLTLSAAATVTGANIPIFGARFQGVGPVTAQTAQGLLLQGTGDPNTFITAPKGTLYARSDGSSTSTRVYVNTSGGSAWTAITTAT